MYFKNIISLYWSNAQNKAPLSHAYTVLLFDILEKQTFKTNYTNNNLMNDIIFFLNNNLSKFYSVDELSNIFSTSKRKITYLFNEYTGFSPHKYQVEMKLTLCNNSINGNPKILLKDLVLKYGFYDEFQLSKLYKKKYGISPKTKLKHQDSVLLLNRILMFFSYTISLKSGIITGSPFFIADSCAQIPAAVIFAPKYSSIHGFLSSIILITNSCTK